MPLPLIRQNTVGSDSSTSSLFFFGDQFFYEGKKPATIYENPYSSLFIPIKDDMSIVSVSGIIPNYRDLLIQRQQRNQVEYYSIHNKNKFKATMTELIKNSEFEYGYFSEADEYLEMLMKIRQELPFLDWIYELYQENFENEEFIVRVLRVLSHIPSENITPKCIAIATQSLESESLEMKENAVRVFENWEYIEAIPLLEKTQFNNSFLDDYVHVVIRNLKELKYGVYDQKD
jgi:hypothetical protein